jgi:heptosyltransferase-1
MSDVTPLRVLVIRLGSLGDLVHTLPAVAALRASLPNTESDAAGIMGPAVAPAVGPAVGMDWVVEEKWMPLIQMVAGIDRVIPIRRSVAGHFDCVHRLRQNRYACAVDFQGLYKSALLAWRSGAPRRIGFDRKTAREPGAAWFYTECVTPRERIGRHMTQLNGSLAVRAGARPPLAMHFPIHVPDVEVEKLAEKLSLAGPSHRGDSYIVVSPGGGWKSKCWPPERYGELCGEIWRKHGIAAVVNAGPGEDELAAAVIRASSPAKPILLCPSLVELCALVKKAQVVVAADTGPLHLAAALGTRVVALFGPTDPARNGPIYEGGKCGTVLRNVSDDANTYKRGEEYSGAMLALTVEQVVAAVDCELGACD